jgi:hypothetical protein
MQRPLLPKDMRIVLTAPKKKKSSGTFSLPERAPTNVMLTQILHVCCLPQQPIDLITDLQTAHQLRISAASAADASQIICETQSINSAVE